ncbi:SRPBCC family protein [Phenylobacterium sp. LjRoot225]|uniref:SRPBCC family protein n=1 Tax=Phenylobacterium sp. LjRoot225 TaxID=3342285 RepID=UPI003ECCEEC4
MEFHVEQVIHAAPAEVARIMFDPDLEDKWVNKAGKAERLTPGPMAVGSRVRHDSGTLGLRGPFVTEVTELDPDRRLAMEIVEGPVRGIIVYQVAPTSGGAIATVHVRNPPKLPIPEVPWVRKQHVQENLHRLAHLLTHSH